jgi:hypothetical protein
VKTAGRWPDRGLRGHSPVFAAIRVKLLENQPHKADGADDSQDSHADIVVGDPWRITEAPQVPSSQFGYRSLTRA